LPVPAASGTGAIDGLKQQRDLYRDAAKLLSDGDPEGAAAACERALAKFPADGNLLCLAARACLACRRPEAARAQIESTLERYPDFALAHDTLGDILLAGNEHEAASRAYARALSLNPDLAVTRRKIERARRLASRSYAGAHGRRRRSGKHAREFSEAARHREAGENQQAEVLCRQILKADPDHVDAARLLAEIATDHERYREAEVFLNRAVELAPDFARAWVDLANVQRHLDRFEDALASAERVLELSPGKAESHMLHASVLGAAGRHEEAVAAFEKVLESDPARTGALCAMAHHLKTIGRQDEAVEGYRRCIGIDPGHGEAWWSLANLKTFRFRDDEVEAMLTQLDAPELPDESRLQIHNALGLEFEARGEYATAFGHFEACNRLRRDREHYDPVDTEATHDRIIGLFDRPFLARAVAAPVSPVPIFIVGLPRSGSTLLEQILASHSAVEGTHELAELSKSVREAARRRRGDRRFPEAFAGLDGEEWARLGRDYIERSAKHRKQGAAFFIDKNPNNYIYAGLIKLALPNAKIINAVRHPLDSCLGSYKQLFASGQPFSYDLVELGEYYLQYWKLITHWHEVMPGFVLDVRYEDVVADLETQVRRLLDSCGLPFEDRCLAFHNTERAIRTASSEQVRRPIYSSSVHLWRNYDDQLGVLSEILEPILTRFPADERPESLTRLVDSSLRDYIHPKKKKTD